MPKTIKQNSSKPGMTFYDFCPTAQQLKQSKDVVQGKVESI